MAEAFEAINQTQSARDKLVSELFKEIEDCMDLLKSQLNKNPNSRFDQNSNRNRDNKRRRKNNHYNNQQQQQQEEEKSFSNNNSNKNNNKKNKNKKSHRRKKDNTNVYMSKRLSFYLRHGAEKAGLKIRKDGYVKVMDILKMNEFKEKNANFEMIKRIVDTNDKKRFSMMEENQIWFIRANQGHSMKSVQSQALLQKLTIKDVNKYPIVCHGTYLKVWDVVKKEGLKTMSRNHIHFVPADSIKGKGVISGMRYNCQILIYIDILKAIKDGIAFYLSDNNVILSPGIDGRLPTKYFKKFSHTFTSFIFINVYIIYIYIQSDYI